MRKMRLTVPEVARRMKISISRVRFKIGLNHFPSAELCPICGDRMTIETSDLQLDVNRHRRKAGRPPN